LSPFGARVRRHAIRRRLLISLMTVLTFHPMSFPSEGSSAHTRLFLTVHAIHRISFILIIHHIRTYIHIFIYKSSTQLHFFRSSWQAGCSPIPVSVTLIFSVFVKYCTDSNISALFISRGGNHISAISLIYWTVQYLQ
jgi:hypothetical protein